MPLPILQSRDIFPITGSALPRVPFRAFGNDFMGVQTTVNSIDETLLDHDQNGGWNGPIWASLYPYKLGITGATYTRVVATQDSDIAHVGTGDSVQLEWGLPPTQYSTHATQRIIVISCADGSEVYNDTIDRTTVTGFTPLPLAQGIGVLADGNYVAWVHVESIPAEQRLPEDYFDVTGYSAIPYRFQYEENGEEFVWDWLHDVGMRPTDKSQISLDGETDMYAEYNRLKLSGGLEDRSDWTSYITIQGQQDGEWSALQFVVGNGAWTQDNAKPAPGAALLMSDGAGGSSEVVFDARARNVLCSWNDNDTTVRVAGTMATRSGPALAYWELHSDNTSTLLAIKLPLFSTDHVCAFASLHYIAADVWVDKDADEYVLSTGYLYQYQAHVADISDRLRGLPLRMDGHPGGRTLRRPDGGVLTFFTDSFSKEPGEFYNRMQLQSDKRYTADGVAFFDDCNADLFQGTLYSFRQTGYLYNSDGTLDEDVKRTLEYLVYDRWTDSEAINYAAYLYNWQRLRTLRASKTGQKILCAGRRQDTGIPIWAVATSAQFKECYSKYYTRRMTAARQSNGYDEIYANAFTVNIGNTKDWMLVAFTGDFVKVCLTWDDITSTMAASVADFATAGIDTDLLPDYLRWNPIETADGGGVWVQTNTLPASGDYLTKNVGGGLVTYAGALPYGKDAWCKICFTAYDDNSTGNDAIEPEACVNNAADAAALFDNPEHICLSLDATVPPMYAIQVSDGNDFVTRLSRKLDSIAATIPNLWARVDSSAAAGDLSSYTIRVPWNRKFDLPFEADVKVEICVLMESGIGKVKAPALENR